MFPVPHRSHQLTMISHGDASARTLSAGHTGDPDLGTGWWGALQGAADRSGDDLEILQIADEIHLFAPLLRTPGRLFAYIDATQDTIKGPAAQAFLRGMRLHLDSTHDTND